MACTGPSALFLAASCAALCIMAARLGVAAQPLAPAATPPPTPGAPDALLCVTPCSLFRSAYMCTNAAGDMITCDPTSGATIASPAGPSTASTSTIGGMPLCSPQPVEGLETVQACNPSALCFPLTQGQLAQGLGPAAADAPPGTLGVCAPARNGLIFPPPQDVPTPMAFFPLSSPALQSFPLGEYKAINDGASILVNTPFGGGLRCSAADADAVALDPVPYGAATGAFTINLWARPGPDFDSTAPLYLYSHRGIDAASAADANTGWGPNQIQVYFPQASHPAHGVLRTYVRDGNDVHSGAESEGYIDSDSRVTDNSGPRGIDGPAIFDGRWHMVTLSTEPEGGEGYRFYVDGALAAELNATTAAAANVSAPGGLHVDGGDPMALGGNIVLCSRSDDPEGRHFDGDVAQLALWDAALNATQVAALYASAVQKVSDFEASAPSMGSVENATAPALSTNATAAEATAAQRTTVSGLPCRFPALMDGVAVTDCVARGSYEYCPIDDEGTQWEACAPAGAGALDVTAPPLAGVPGTPSAFDPEAVDTSDYAQLEDLDSAGYAGAGAAAASAVRGPLYAADGRACVLPLSHRGAQVDNCVSFGGGRFCWTGDATGAGAASAWAPCTADALLEPPEPGPLGVGPSAVAVLQLQQPLQFTIDGSACAFPAIAPGGTIIDECTALEKGGPLVCQDADGEWKDCAPDSNTEEVKQEESTAREFHAAERVAVTEAACVFPAVSEDYLWFDCADVEPLAGAEDPESARQVCPTAAATWEVCAPPNGTFSTKSLDIPAALGARTAPGLVGHPCAMDDDVDSATPQGCADGLTCVPLPRLVNSTDPAASPLRGAGFCAARPNGTTFGLFHALDKSAAPQPLAFFPLTGGELDALTLPRYTGAALGSLEPFWADDAMFGSALVCNRTSGNAVRLDNVPYGLRGPFTLSLWARRLPGISNFSGDTFQYLFSHASPAAAPGFSPNQVAIYLPDSQHPAAGAVRAYVKDSTDDAWDMTYIDSDGAVESNTNRTTPPQHGDVNDGGWHMVTLTAGGNSSAAGAQGEGGDEGGGFVLYVDGEEAARLRQPTPLPDGSVAVPTGGDPALMAADVVLCGRSDLAPPGSPDARYYDGALAHLALWDAALSADQIKDLYDTYDAGKYGTAGAAAGGDSEQWAEAKDAGMEGDDESGTDGALVAGIVMASIGAAVAVGAVGALAVGAVRRRRRAARGGARFERFHENSTFFSDTERGAFSDSSEFSGDGHATLNIQLASSGGGGGLKPVPSETLTKEASLPTEIYTSAPGLLQLPHGGGGGGSASGGGGPQARLSGNPFASVAAAVPHVPGVKTNGPGSSSGGP